jgi:hypothetical protein
VESTLRALEERVNVDYPDAWLPETNHSHPNPLVGEIVDRREATTRRDSVETVLVVKTEDGTVWSLWLLGAVLQRELGAAQPGDRLAVRWLGMRPNAEGTPYRSYRVALESATVGKESA